MFALRSLALGCVLLGACGGKHPPPQTTSASATALDVVAQTTCYRGTSTLGEQQSEVLLQRIVDPVKHQVIELVSSPNETGGYQDFRVEMSVSDDGTFSMQETSGLFTGLGAFTAGEPWQWTAWTSTSTGAGNSFTAESTDELRGETLIANKTIKLPEFEMSISELYTTVTCAEYEARHSELVAPADQTK